MGWQGAGGALAPGWVRTIGSKPLTPLGTIAAGRVNLSIAHATRILKLKILARDGPGFKNARCGTLRDTVPNMVGPGGFI